MPSCLPFRIEQQNDLPQANRLVLSLRLLRYDMHLQLHCQEYIINLWKELKFTLEGSGEKMEETVEGEDESHQKQTQHVKGKEAFLMCYFGESIVMERSKRILMVFEGEGNVPRRG